MMLHCQISALDTLEVIDGPTPKTVALRFQREGEPDQSRSILLSAEDASALCTRLNDLVRS